MSQQSAAGQKGRSTENRLISLLYMALQPSVRQVSHRTHLRGKSWHKVTVISVRKKSMHVSRWRCLMHSPPPCASMKPLRLSSLRLYGAKWRDESSHSHQRWAAGTNGISQPEKAPHCLRLKRGQWVGVCPDNLLNSNSNFGFVQQHNRVT